MLQHVKAAWFEGEGNHDKLRCIFINLFPSCRRDIGFQLFISGRVLPLTADRSTFGVLFQSLAPRLFLNLLCCDFLSEVFVPPLASNNVKVKKSLEISRKEIDRWLA